VSTRQDVDDAVRYANEAFRNGWRDLSFDERAEYIVKFADALEQNLPGVIDLLSREAGKSSASAGFEAGWAVMHLRETAKLRIPEEVIDNGDGAIVTVRHVPLGVGVAIVPWNFPLLLGVGKLGAALLAGNTLIWKPSPYSPNTACKVVEIAAKVFPPGVVQVLSGTEDLGPWLTSHPDVAKISFTGSTPTGKKVMAACANTLKRVTLELGGNDAAIVCEDVNIDEVVPNVR